MLTPSTIVGRSWLGGIGPINNITLLENRSNQNIKTQEEAGAELWQNQLAMVSNFTVRSSIKLFALFLFQVSRADFRAY